MRGDGGRRNQIKADAEILVLLPKESKAYKDLESHIEGEVLQLRRWSSGKQNWTMFVFALVAAPLLGWSSFLFFARDVWWSYIAGVATTMLALVFLYGLFETGQRVPRDEKGKRIENGAKNDL